MSVKRRRPPTWVGYARELSPDRRRETPRRIGVWLLSAVALTALQASAEDVDLASFSLEELGNIRITSVSRVPQSLSTAPGSVFVITGEDIRRYGVTSLPEALRLAPNLLVAQVSATEYAISARGFNNSIGNKLLVLIDGRTVYTPLFSGVFWDAQDVMLDDIERIEILSGPGATIWGLNAVNGVINVITRSARGTQDAVLNVGAGNLERTASFRYGGKAGANGHYRVYGKYLTVENTQSAAGTEIPDAWSDAQIGFRADWGEAEGTTFTLQGDLYSGQSDAQPLNDLDISGLNLVARWDRTFAGGSNLRIQSYFDHSERSDLPIFEEELDVFDIEIQHSLDLDAHQLVWGGGYRRAEDDVRNSAAIAFLPARRSLSWANAFVQDTLAMTPNVALTLGAKIETNDYTDTEFLPTIRVGWTRPDSGLVWAALSRAVRAPARLDREIYVPGIAPYQVAGGPDFESEVSDVLEIGYRAEPTATLSYSVTAFHHEHDKLRSVEPTPAGPMALGNQIEGSTSGIEGWATWQRNERWRLSGGVLTLNQDLERKPGSLDPTGPRSLGNDPDFQLVLRSTINFAQGRQLDVLARHVDDLPDPAVPSYTAVDARFAFTLGEATMLSITLRNILDSQHAEFGSAVTRSEYERAGFVALEWRLP